MADLFDTLNPVDTKAAAPVSDIFDQLNPVTTENKSSSSTPETDKAVAQTAAAASRMPATGPEARLPDYGALKAGKVQFQQGAQLPDSPLVPPEVFQAGMWANPVTAVPMAINYAVTPRIEQGLERGAAETLSGFTTPSNAPLLATAPFFPEGVVGKVLGTALGGAFEAQQIIHDPEQFKQLKSAWDKGDYGEVARIGSQMFTGHALPAIAPFVAAKGAKPVSSAEQAPAAIEFQPKTEEVIQPEKTQEGQAVAGAERPQETQTLAEPAAASVPESASAAEPLLRPTPSGPELNPYFSVDRVPEATGISNERLKQIYGEDAVTVGKGRGAKEWQKIGQADTRDPYAVLTAARATGIASPKDVALLRAEHQRLLAYARNSYGTPAYDMLAQNSADMANAIKGVAHGPASDVFRALQDTDMPRYDSPADFDSIIRERMNRESTPDEHATFKKVSDELRNGYQEVIKTAADAQNNLRRYRSNEVVSFDEAVKHIKDQIESITKDCNL